MIFTIGSPNKGSLIFLMIERRKEMDELNIVTGFTRTIISKMLRKFLQKKIGTDVDVKLNTIKVNMVEDKAYVHLDIEAELIKGELMKLIKDYI